MYIPLFFFFFCPKFLLIFFFFFFFYLPHILVGKGAGDKNVEQEVGTFAFSEIERALTYVHNFSSWQIYVLYGTVLCLQYLNLTTLKRTRI